MSEVENIWADLDKVTLRSGMGTGKEGDSCVIQEIRRRTGLDSKTDACPPTMCPVVHKLMIQANDSYTTPPSELLLLAPQALVTRGDMATTVRRAMRMATEALRLLAPMFDAIGKKEQADKFRDYPLILTKEAADQAKKLASNASDANYAASYASYAASDASYASYAASYASYAASYASYAASDASYAASNASDANYAASYASYAASNASDAASYAASNAASYASYASYAASYAAKKAKGEFCLRMIREFCAEEVAK